MGKWAPSSSCAQFTGQGHICLQCFGSGSNLSLWCVSVSYLSIWCGSGIFRILSPTFIQIRTLQFSKMTLTPFHFDADPDPAFYFDTDLDQAFHFDAEPAFQNDKDPFGSGSSTLFVSIKCGSGSGLLIVRGSDLVQFIVKYLITINILLFLKVRDFRILCGKIS